MQKELPFRKLVNEHNEKCYSCNIENMNQQTPSYYIQDSLFQFSGKRNDKSRKKNDYTESITTFDDANNK